MVELATRLDRERFSPKVFCLGPPGDLVEVLEAAEVPVICLGAKRLRDVWVLPRLIRELRKFRPAILQTWLYHANMLGRLAGRRANVPIIVSGIRVAERRSRFRLWAERIDPALGTSACLREPGRSEVLDRKRKAQRRARARHSQRRRYQPIYKRGARRSSQYRESPHGSKTILFVGRLDPQKDPLWLLDVFSKVRTSLADVHLAYVGRGILESRLMEEIERRDLTALRARLGLARRCAGASPSRRRARAAFALGRPAERGLGSVRGGDAGGRVGGGRNFRIDHRSENRAGRLFAESRRNWRAESWKS